MPVEIKAYACEYRCGRIRVKPESLTKHEKTCFLNPARRACVTCKHEGHDFAEGHKSRECSASGELPDKLEERFDKYDIVWDCPLWESEE